MTNPWRCNAANQAIRNAGTDAEVPDLIPFGWAPGGYSFICRDSEHVNSGNGLIGQGGYSVFSDTGDKRCTRCEICARRRWQHAQDMAAAEIAAAAIDMAQADADEAQFEFVDDDFKAMGAKSDAERAADIAKRIEQRRSDAVKRDGKVRAPQLTRDGLIARDDSEMCVPVSKAMTVALLVAKLHSETEEIALDLRNPEEYGDVIETLHALASLNGVTGAQIEASRREKHERKGGLVQGNFWVPTEFTIGGNNGKR